MNNRKQLLSETYARLFKGKPASNDRKLLREFREENGPFGEDGWNDDWFEEIGMMEALAEAAKIDYEIKNARRGSYATDGTLSGLADQLLQLARTFENLSDQLMEAKDQFGDEQEY
jgi:hypothetical protein